MGGAVPETETATTADVVVASKQEDEQLPPTDVLYMTYEGNWLTECTSQIINIESSSDDNLVTVILDRTVMHAQGGGQPTDKGTITVPLDGNEVVIDVTKVLLDRSTGVASHTGTLRLKDTDDGNAVNSLLASLLHKSSIPRPPASVQIDTDLRRILSECHTAGHVVDSAMARCGKTYPPSKAYHFLEGPYVEYKGVVDASEKDSLLQNLQSAFCQLVDEQIDTKIELMSKQQADEICNRQAQNFDMDVFADPRTDQIRVVTVAGFPCPCGGTHVRNTTDLKTPERRWGIIGLKSKKGVVRVRYGQL